MAETYRAPAASAMLALMEFMAGHPGAWGVSELARRAGLSANLTFRVVNILVERGYAAKNAAGQYELTAGLFSLGMKLQHQFDLRKQARPHLEELATLTRESVQIQIPDGDRMLQLDFVPPPADYYLAVASGSRLHWHANAFGKAVFAFLPEDRVADLLDAAPLPRLTPKTVIAPRTLRAELLRVREEGVATEFDEYVMGSYCVGAPVFSADGRPLAGVGVTGLSSRLGTRTEAETKKAVRACAARISRALGFSGAPDTPVPSFAGAAP